MDLGQFSAGRRDTDLRRELAPNGELLVGVVARLAVEKRLELLGPVSRLPGVRLVVVGDGPQRRRLGRLLPDAHFTGQLTGTDLGRMVAAFDPFSSIRTWARLGDELIGHYLGALGSRAPLQPHRTALPARV